MEKEPLTQSQRGLYWIWLQDIERELGTPKDTVHNSFKKIFLKGGSTSTLGKVGFSAYMELIHQWCSKHDITLSEPSHDKENSFKE